MMGIKMALTTGRLDYLTADWKENNKANNAI